MIINKKAKLSILGDIIILLIIVGLVVFILPKNVFAGINQVKLLKYKQTCDKDGDGLLAEDKCPCNYGNINDYEYYRLREYANCVLTKNDKGNFVFDDAWTSDKSDCEKNYIKARSDVKECAATDSKFPSEGLSETCMKAVCEKAGTSADALCIRLCKTPDKTCDSELYKYCKDNEGVVNVNV